MEQRRSFTLIELFIAIGVLSLIASVVLFRSKTMIEHYRFSQGAEKLRREITFSKRIAQTASTFIEFSLEQEGDQLICMRKTDEPLNLKGSLNTPIVIPSVHLDGGQKKTILITSNGWVEKDVEIKISLGNRTKTIDARKDID